jgi:hypothetical protein
MTGNDLLHVLATGHIFAEKLYVFPGETSALHHAFCEALLIDRVQVEHVPCVQVADELTDLPQSGHMPVRLREMTLRDGFAQELKVGLWADRIISQIFTVESLCESIPIHVGAESG